MQIDIISTQRLILRKIDEPTLQYIYQDYSIDEQMKFLGLSSIEALQNEKSKFDKGLSTFNKHFLYFQLLDKISKKIIGWCGYHTWYIEHQRAEIGYGLFDDDFKNKGLMSEAMEVVLKYGFTQMDLNRVEAFIGPENVPSLKLVQKFGFVKEGQLRQHYFKNDRMEDSVVFGLLKEKYKNTSNNS